MGETRGIPEPEVAATTIGRYGLRRGLPWQSAERPLCHEQGCPRNGMTAAETR